MALDRLFSLSVLCVWYLVLSWVSDSFIHSLIHPSSNIRVLLLCVRGCARHWGTAESKTAGLVAGHNPSSRCASKRGHPTQPMTSSPSAWWWAYDAPLHPQPLDSSHDTSSSALGLYSPQSRAWGHQGTLCFSHPEPDIKSSQCSRQILNHHPSVTLAAQSQAPFCILCPDSRGYF